jgi:hypothetical protein
MACGPARSDSAAAAEHKAELGAGRGHGSGAAAWRHVQQREEGRHGAGENGEGGWRLKTTEKTARRGKIPWAREMDEQLQSMDREPTALRGRGTGRVRLEEMGVESWAATMAGLWSRGSS